MTTLFAATYVFGQAAAVDDIAAVAWIPVDEIGDSLVAPHLPLARRLRPYLENYEGGPHERTT